MIHSIFKKSTEFTFLCLCIGIMANYGNEELLKQYHDNMGLILVFIAASAFAFWQGAKKAKKMHEDDYLSWTIWKCIDNAIVPLLLSFVLIDEARTMIVKNYIGLFAVYLGLCIIIPTDETENLSGTKTFIASVIVSPIVVWGLLKYNNNQAKDMTEKHMERAQRALSDGAYMEAANEANGAIDVCSKKEEASYQLAKCYYLRGKAFGLAGEEDQARKDLKQALRFGTGDSFLVEVQKELDRLDE